MKIKDLEGKLPARVKITDGFTTEESIDPGFVVDIVQIEIYEGWEENNCYKIYFSIPDELVPICTKVAKHDWYDKNSNPCLNYFQANKKNYINGEYRDFTYVMDTDDWFEFYEEPDNQLVKINFLTDNDGTYYFIPSEFSQDFYDMCNGLECDENSTEYHKAETLYYKKFSAYKIEGDVSNYQLYISKSDLKEITGEQ